MRKPVFLAFVFFIFQIFGLTYPLYCEGSGEQKSNLPPAFLQRNDGKVIINTGEESFSLESTKATLEEILQRCASEEKVHLNFYCKDPSMNQERAASISLKGDSMIKAIGQLLPEHKLILFDREGKTIEGGKDVATVNIYPRQCTQTGAPVRVFVPARKHPVLGKAPEEISVEELREVLKKEGPACRRRAAEILGKKADEKAIPLAQEALKDENPAVMFAAANALKQLGQKYGPQKVADAIYGRFKEKPYVDFLMIMAEVDKERIWAILDRLMDQSGDSEKNVITRALVSTKDSRSIEYLSKISAASPRNSRQAIEGIGRIGGPEAARTLMGLLKGGDIQKQAWAAASIRFLAKEDGSEARAAVDKIVKDEGVSNELLKALSDVYFLEPLEKLMKDPGLKPEQKLRVLKALGSRGPEKTFAVRSIGLNDESPQVRLVSVEAIVNVPLVKSIPHLVKATEDKDAKVRRVAVRGLASFRPRDETVAALGKAVRDPDENVRRQAIDSLKMMGKPSEAMIAILKECENHKDSYISNKAESILKYWHLDK